MPGGVGGRGLSGGRSRSDPLGDDDAWQIVPPQDTGIGTMEESIAASVNYVANLQAAEGGTAGERAARFVQVSPQEWYLNTIREWVQRHSRIPIWGYWNRDDVLYSTNYAEYGDDDDSDDDDNGDDNGGDDKTGDDGKGGQGAETDTRVRQTPRGNPSTPQVKEGVETDTRVRQTPRGTTLPTQSANVPITPQVKDQGDGAPDPAGDGGGDGDGDGDGDADAAAPARRARKPWQTMVDWVDNAWRLLGHSRDNRVRDADPDGPQPGTSEVTAAVLAEGDWNVEENWAFSWTASVCRPKFPALQGADAHVYLDGHAFCSLWSVYDLDERMWDMRVRRSKRSAATLIVNPAYPIAAFPSWKLPLPEGAKRLGYSCDGFYCHNLLSDEAHREIVECFDELRDVQGACVVPQYTMIIDPNMHLAVSQPVSEATHHPPMRTDWSSPIPQIPKHPQACWAATPFALVARDSSDAEAGRSDAAEAVRLGPINALEADGDLAARVGGAFETVLAAAAPMLAGLRRPSLLLPGPLQAVCKAQRIFLQPGEVYEGVWHVDGDDENVVAVILYYYRYSEDIIGGDIEFIGKELGPLLQDGETVEGADYADQMFRRGRAPIKEGTCVVFSNHQLVHRILTMLNASDVNQANRDFLAFFVIDQREPVGTTLDMEVLPTPSSSAATVTGDEASSVGAEVAPAEAAAATEAAAAAGEGGGPEDPAPRFAVAENPYLQESRAGTFADRDHRRRLRLFEQLTPKSSFRLDGEVNGQSACVTGNGSLAWVGWTQGQPSNNSGMDPDDYDHIDNIGVILKASTQPSPINRGLSFANELATRRFPTDPRALRPLLILGRVSPTDVVPIEVPMRWGGGMTATQAAPLLWAVSNNKIALAHVLLEYGAPMPRVVPLSQSATKRNWYNLEQSERNGYTRLGYTLGFLTHLFGSETLPTERGFTLLAATIRNQWGDPVADGANPMPVRTDWDDLSDQNRAALTLLGWSAFSYNQLQAFTTAKVGPASSLDEATAREVAKRFLSGARVCSISRNVDPFLLSCRFDKDGLATFLGQIPEAEARSLFWSPIAHKTAPAWSREAVTTLLLVAARLSRDQSPLALPSEMWRAVLCSFRPFELGNQRSYRGPANEALYNEPPSLVYTGPVGLEASRWVGELVGSYTAPDGTVTTLDSGVDGSVMWRGIPFGPVRLELTASTHRLKAADRAGEGQSYSLSMIVEVVHSGSGKDMGTVSEIVVNCVDRYKRV